ncbi:cytochrome P450 [Pyxidicoccus sp. 3LFB2]
MTTLPPLPPRVELPVVQQSLLWRARPYELLRSCRERLGDAFTLELGSHGTYAMFSHPDALRDIFSADPAVLHAGEGNAVLRPLLGAHSLLLLEEQPHQRERRMLGPAFHSRRIEQYGALVREATLAVLQDWLPGQTVIVQDAMQRVSLRVILTAVFGLEGGARAEELSERIQAFLNDSKFNLGNLSQLREDDAASGAWATFKRALERIDQLLLEEVRHRRAVGDSERGDILGMLLAAKYEDGAPLEDAVLRDELMTLVVTGYETTATAIAWALHWLHVSPPALARLREELRGARATPSQLLADMEDASEVELHAHGMFSSAVSDASLVVLAPDLDGRYALTADRVRKARLARAPMVLLATCSAARTAPYLHEPFSLPVAFIEAGASVVLASTTDIPDTAGAFFEEVRELIRGRARPSAALRDARARWLKEHPDDARWLAHVLLFE